MEAIVRFFREEEGPTATEYAVMLALMVVVMVGAITVLGRTLNDPVYRDINNGVTNAAGP